MPAKPPKPNGEALLSWRSTIDSFRRKIAQGGSAAGLGRSPVRLFNPESG
jgi:hypothetical protein